MKGMFVLRLDYFPGGPDSQIIGAATAITEQEVIDAQRDVLHFALIRMRQQLAESRRDYDGHSLRPQEERNQR